MAVRLLLLTQAEESYKLKNPENMDPLPPPHDCRSQQEAVKCIPPLAEYGATLYSSSQHLDPTVPQEKPHNPGFLQSPKLPSSFPPKRDLVEQVPDTFTKQ